VDSGGRCHPSHRPTRAPDCPAAHLPGRRARARRTLPLLLVLLAAGATPARAVLDIADRGPMLNAGSFALRITNAGILGNAFFNQGLSYDPSFEYPKGSGHECLNHAELWVGAVDADGRTRVSGGPMLEWRPTPDPDDRVLTAWAGRPGAKRGYDDDGDGAYDEEIFNGRDDDLDGEIDEDLGLPSDQACAAEYVDDRPEAVNYGYPNGETHLPLGLSVHQEAYAWALPGYDNLAGLEFTITNHGNQTLRDLYLGVYCDLDSRGRDDVAGHLNDVVSFQNWSLVIPLPNAALNGVSKRCYDRYGAWMPVVMDESATSGLPASAVVGLGHTTDPLGFLTNYNFPGAREAHDAARAPTRDTTFRYSVFAQDHPPGQGGPPPLDGDRYLALQGKYPTAARPDLPADYAVLVSCGPFASLAPGQSVRFQVGLVAAVATDSVLSALSAVAYLHRGFRLNLIKDAASRPGSYNIGVSGINGHEVCLEPPVGITFHYDPNCVEKFLTDPGFRPFPPMWIPPSESADSTYTHGHCIWTDADCDACTGYDGAETVFHWLSPGTVPPRPGYRISPGDHQVTIAWDNQPEIQLKANLAGTSGFDFAGYRVYRLSDWTRESQVPPADSWELIGVFAPDTLNRERLLSAITDSTLDWDAIQYGQKHYPIGRYRIVDDQVLNGFDYLYVVTTVSERRVTRDSTVLIERLESPLATTLDSIVVAHTVARPRGDQAWVVPNPYRGSAPWDRPPVPGDPFGRHLDFMGLPEAPCTIRIYTVAGDLVAQIDHDGSSGDGQTSWDLISRNGQDVESGIYLFTVDSSLGHQIGRFVVIR
jgi:hypothetical protein